MLNFPMKFSVKSAAQPGIHVNWQTSTISTDQALPSAVPVQFGGLGRAFSPEDFYALSISNCLIGTFKVYAEKSDLQFEEITCDCTLDVDRNEKGVPWMSKVDINVQLYHPSSKEKAEALIKKTIRESMVLNSIKTAINVHFEIIQ